MAGEEDKYPVILPWKVVLPTHKKNSSSGFRGLHPQPTHHENRLLSHPEAVCTLVRMKGPCWEAGSLPAGPPSVPVALGPCASSRHCRARERDSSQASTQTDSGLGCFPTSPSPVTLLTSLLAAEDGSYRERHGNKAFNLRPCKYAEGCRALLRAHWEGGLFGCHLWSCWKQQ